MPSDGAGGRSGGDGDRGSGGSSDSGRGGGDGNNGQGVGGHRGGGRGDANNANGAGNTADGGRGNGSEGSNVSGRSSMSSGGVNQSGHGGFGGLGIGNPASYGAKANPVGYEKSVNVQDQRDTLNMAGKVTRGLGAVLGAPVSLAGYAMSAAAKYGRVEGELTDMERAAKANGMGAPQHGDSSSTLTALAGNLNTKDPAQKALLESITPTAPTGPTPTKTGAQLREYARA